MLLESVQLKGKIIPLAKPKVTKGANVVTVIMGNNGSGKSYLFQNICFAFIKAHYKNNFQYELNNFSNIPKENELNELAYLNNGISYSISKQVQPFLMSYEIPKDKITLVSHYPYETAIQQTGTKDGEIYQHLMDHFLTHVQSQSHKPIFKRNSQSVDFKDLEFPSKILAITGSPYDKFPFLERRSHLKLTIPYVYLGTRTSDLPGVRSKRGYLSNKFDQLGASFIKLLLKPKRKYFDFSKVFNYLNMSNTFTLKLSLSQRFRVEDVEKSKILDMIRSIKFFKDKDHDEFRRETENRELAEQLVNALEYVLEGKVLDNHFFQPIEISCVINLEKEHENKELLSSLELLTEYDLIELNDVEFKKRDSLSEFLLSEASSGELSLLFTMSSIAGEIENNSLILIDEPELSLHPSWQLSFLELLQSTFSNYKNCHFIIATHSPNLISSISKEDAFIVNLSLDKPELMESKDYHNRSADFQLAKVFDAPGNSNEYLIKLAINIFSKVKTNKTFDEEDIKNLDFMNEIRGSLPANDSVIELIEMLNEVYQKYG